MLSALPLKQLLSAVPVPLLRGELAVNIPGMVWRILRQLVQLLLHAAGFETACAALKLPCS